MIGPDAADIQCSKTYLQNNHAVGSISDGPDDPKRIAQQKNPESPVAFEFSTRRYQPGTCHGDKHRGPLHQGQPCALHA